METLRPFFTYFGGKYRAAPKYPAPRYSSIVEPFAGAAGYSVRHFQRDIILAERNPVIAGLWRYLVGVSEAEIRGLPLKVDCVDDLSCCQEAKWLIGFWLNKAATGPRRRPSKWMRDGIRPRSFWGAEIRERVASQVGRIRHWRVVEDSYERLANIEATWFCDPPYQVAGTHYTYGCRDIDYVALADWCQSRKGQVIVCEAEGATWLPFRPFMLAKANSGIHGKGYSREVIWTTEPDDSTPSPLQEEASNADSHAPGRFLTSLPR